LHRKAVGTDGVVRCTIGLDTGQPYGWSE
jgi:hypothetical protein